MKSIITLIIVLTTLQAGAIQGHDRGGGGDPRAVKFLNFGTAAAELIKGGADSADAKLVREEVERLYKSLDKKEPQLRFHQTEVINCFGVEKKGCRNSDDTIDVAGKYWEDAKTSDQDRCVLALTELIRAQSISNVYRKADSICRAVIVNSSSVAGSSYMGQKLIAKEAIVIPAGQGLVQVSLPKLSATLEDVWFSCNLNVGAQSFERTISKNAVFYVTDIINYPKNRMTADDLRAQFKAFFGFELDKKLAAEEILSLARNRYGIILPTDSFTSTIEIKSATSGAKASITCVDFDERNSQSVLGRLLKFSKIIPVSEL